MQRRSTFDHHFVGGVVAFVRSNFSVAVPHFELECFARVLHQKLVDFGVKVSIGYAVATQFDGLFAQLNVRVHQELLYDEQRARMVSLVRVEREHGPLLY